VSSTGNVSCLQLSERLQCTVHVCEDLIDQASNTMQLRAQQCNIVCSSVRSYNVR